MHVTIRRFQSTRSDHVRTAAGSPRGFTLVELLIAVIILSIGVLGLAGTSGMVVRTIGVTRLQTQAAQVAQSRVETMRSTRGSCASFANGSATTNGMSESWTVAVSGSAVDVNESVTFNTAYGSRTQGYHTMIAC
ncbi:MAG: hypothetical protein NVS4B6_22580 [Mycobacterium sp.]